MKSHYPLITFLFFGIISFIVFDAAHNSADSHTSGAPATRTGSPGDGGATCKNCHAGPNPTTEAGLITSNIPPDGYVPGQTYTVTATVARSGHTKFGFEISPQNVAGSKLGTLIVTNSTEMQLVGSGKYITHKTAGVSGAGSRTWEFDWTAPVAGTGDVTFYGAFNITNAMNNSSGDTTVLSTLLVSECAPPAQPGSITGPDILCQSSGIVNYSISPVVGAASYNWTFPAGWTMIGPSSESIQVQPNVNSGTISVTVSNACGTSQASILTVSIDQISVSSVVADVSCNAGSNGTATAVAASGVGAYDYLWSPGGQTTDVITNLSAGNYTVTVTDDVGCTASTIAIVNEPDAIQLNTSVTNAACGASDGTAEVNASGGIPNYSYLWNSVPPQTTQMATNLSAGNYTVTVTDQNGCTATANALVSTGAGPTASAQSVSNVRCHNGNDGEASASAINGTAPYTYQWSPSGGTDAIAQNLHAGAYTVTVSDANGCTSIANVVITEPTPIQLGTFTTDAACGQSNGTAGVTASGGVGGYTYMWNSVPVQTTPIATNLPAGSYIITVTDSNGCSISETVGVSNISGPTVQAGTITNVTCFGGDDGALSVIVSGGTGPYAYAWLPSGGNDTLAKNLHAGAYSVTVTDALGCISVLTGTVTEPSELVAQPGSGFNVCVGESVTLGISPVASGGVAGYSYLWSPAGALNNPMDSMPVASPFITTSFLLVVTDDHGCTDSAFTVVTVNPIPVTPQITANTDSLFSTSAAGYQWYLNGNIISGATSQIYVPQQTGNYSVIVSDVNGCTAASSDFFFEFSSIGNMTSAGSMEVYPSPAAQTLYIRLTEIKEIEIHVINLNGEKIVMHHPKGASDFYTLDVSALAPGMYVLEVSGLSKSQILRKAFIKE